MPPAPPARFAYEVCPKIAVFSGERVLVARRTREEELDGVYTLVGGKLETSDRDVLAGIHRELREELGGGLIVRILTTYAVMDEFTKRGGVRMVLPHYYGELSGGSIVVGSEYSDFRWLMPDELEARRDVFQNVAIVCRQLVRLASSAGATDYTEVAT